MCKCISALSIYTIHIFWKHNTKLLYGRAHKSRQDKMFCFSRAFMVLVCVLAYSCACPKRITTNTNVIASLAAWQPDGRPSMNFELVIFASHWYSLGSILWRHSTFFSFWTTFPVTLSNSIWYDIRMLCVLCVSFFRSFSLSACYLGAINKIVNGKCGHCLSIVHITLKFIYCFINALFLIHSRSFSCIPSILLVAMFIRVLICSHINMYLSFVQATWRHEWINFDCNHYSVYDFGTWLDKAHLCIIQLAIVFRDFQRIFAHFSNILN